MGEKLTPLMKQYWEIKELHADKILFFRMGDFFELFHDDAVTAAPLLGIALTARNRKSEDETPMCGVPHHSVPQHINKLLRHGYKVALCDQIEDPKEAKGLVKRAVTRVLSPGMVYDPENVESGCANYLAACDENSVAFFDSTTGEAFYFFVAPAEHLRLLQVFRPVEVVLNPEQQKIWEAEKYHLGFAIHSTVWGDAQLSARDRLKSYACSMQGEDLSRTFPEFEQRNMTARLQLGAQVLRHLEVFENYRGETRGSLLQVIDKTKTAGGARFLRYWLSTPTVDRELLRVRHDAIEFWMQDAFHLKQIRERLGRLGDVERRVMKLANPSCNPRDLVSLALTLQAGCELSQDLGGLRAKWNAEIEKAKSLAQDLLSSFVEEPPFNPREGRIFNAGISEELDGLIRLTDDAEGALLEMEQREREQTGISSLKIRYNNVFGYYLEVTNTHRDRVPSHYQRKQTLANAERFVTPALLELEQQILSARTRRERLEFELFVQWKERILGEVTSLLKLAHAWSELDVLTSFAWLALEHRYVRPHFVESGMKLIGSRHPVVEQLVSEPFVANDICLTKGECLLLTGPNMAGKSTLMRQVALSVLLAQIGCFVPATRAELPLFKGCLTRIGASDALWDGLSTFMVEMTETADLIHRAGPDTLVILDEIGRGTSTFDGMSLAQAILEDLVQRARCTTFFATHYHELTELAEHFPQIQNGHMSLRERSGELSFLYTLKSGPANRSYGILVGKRAGLPARVVQRASLILKQKEKMSHELEEGLRGPQLSLFQPPAESPQPQSAQAELDLISEMMSWQLEQMTPLEVFRRMEELQARIRESQQAKESVTSPRPVLI